MMRGSVLFPETSEAVAPARPELDLGGWPAWIRDALAIQPETKVPAYSTEIEPARVDPASVRKLTRMPGPR
jgi:hypothetical protein